jgi:polysaccharide biosynthesis/export protein
MVSARFGLRRLCIAAVACAHLSVTAPLWARQNLAEYLIGSPDVLVINVWGQTNLSGRYQVAPDGNVTVPLIGAVLAAGRRPKQLETEIQERLAKGYLRLPQVSVSVAEYLSQRVFVMGEVKTPGPIAITGAMTLLDALARAGSLTEDAGGDLVVVRPSTAGTPSSSPVLPGEPDITIVVQVSVRDLRRGTLARNEALRPGDTVFVPRAESFQVLGQVNKPGSFSSETGMTVLRALSLAGGATALGATNRVKIVRVVDGKRQEVRARLEDPVRVGDTIVVPTRLW